MQLTPYNHDEIFTTKYGKENERLYNLSYSKQPDVFEDLNTTKNTKEFKKQLFWFLCYLLQEIHKKYHLSQPALKDSLVSGYDDIKDFEIKS